MMDAEERKARLRELANKESLTPDEIGMAYDFAQEDEFQDDEFDEGLADLYAKYINPVTDLIWKSSF